MKPWERALARDPLCAFIDAVVDGYSPIDKWTCHFARHAQQMRQLPWWDRPAEASPLRGCVIRRGGYHFSDEHTGEMPWRTLHAE